MSRRDAPWIAGALIAGALGLTCYIQLFDRAFPVASLNFRVDREQAYEAAETYLHRLGYDLSEYESAQVFSRSSLPQVFLERTIGLAEANRLVREWVSVWYWRVRWFKPLQKEELRVRIDPGGRIAGFSHSILESDEGASLSQEEARVVAETFLAGTQGFQLDAYEPVEASSVERPNRTDHTFTYRKKEFVVGDDGHYRLSVTVQGDKPGSFYEYLKVPETFSRDYREIRTRAGLLARIASGFALALGLAMAVLLVRKFRRRALAWRAAVSVGILAGAVDFVAAVNGYPLTYFGYDTTQSFVSFLLAFLFSSLVSAASIGLMISLCGAAGGAAAQDVKGWKNPLARLSLRNWRSAGFARVTLVGYGLAFAHLGYVTLFYILGSDYLGVWSPAAMTQYSNAYSTYLPWIYPLLTGVVAAATEEFFFRLFAISLLIRWLKKTWLAVLVPAVVWAFLHADYPQEPVYIRGLELTLAGILFGMVFLRFGVWATVVSHYVYNCFLGIYPMVQYGQPLLQSLRHPRRRGNLHPGTAGHMGRPPPPATGNRMNPKKRRPPKRPGKPTRSQARHPPLPNRHPNPGSSANRPRTTSFPGRSWSLIGILGLIGWSAYFTMKPPKFASYSRESIVARSEAVQRAEEIRGALGLELEGYRRTARFSSSLGSSHFSHLLRKVGPTLADTLAAEHTSSWNWKVRWFKPLEKEELNLRIDGRGNLSFISHAVPENQEGGELTNEEAQDVAKAFLLDWFDLDVADTTLYKPLEARSYKRENRVDHSFVWERTDIKVEDGEFRIVASVQGSRIGTAYKAYKAPEEFLRELRERTARSTIVSTLSTIAVLVTAVLAAVHLLRLYRNRQVDRKLPLVAGILACLHFTLEELNGLPAFFKDYNTSEAMGTFLGGEAIGLVTGAAAVGIFIFLLCALGDTLYRLERPREMQIADWIDVLRLKRGAAGLWWQAVFLALCYLGVRRGGGVFSSHLHQACLGDYLTTFGGVPGSINTFLPALGELLDELKDLLKIPVILGILFSGSGQLGQHGQFFLLCFSLSSSNPWSRPRRISTTRGFSFPVTSRTG